MASIPRALPWSCLLLSLSTSMAADEPPHLEVKEGLTRPAQARRVDGRSRAYKDRVEPRWFDQNRRFWYRNELPGGTHEFIAVDAEHARREPAFDHARLAESLSKAAGATYRAESLPFTEIEPTAEPAAVRFRLDGVTWACDLSSYACAKVDGNPTLRAPAPPADAPRRREEAPGRDSPDGKRSAFVRDHNVFIREVADGKESCLSDDGTEARPYARLAWSPDSSTVVAWRVTPGEDKPVYLVQSSPPGGGRANLRQRPYPLPGDKFDVFELNLFDAESKAARRPPVDPINFGEPRLRWDKDGHRFTYEQTDRGHQRFRLVEVDVRSGDTRNLIDERTQTFLWTAHRESQAFRTVNWLRESDEILYLTERTGFRHIERIDAATGEVKNAATRGDFVVRGIEHVDEPSHQIIFTASGKEAGQDPYFLHHYRVDLDGKNLVRLTEGDGTHAASYSPDYRYLVDTYSRVDAPPVHNLRRATDGSLVCKLEESDVSAVLASGWVAPEIFTAKGRDGTTDIWGIICRPKEFDPSKKYPVIEQIYAGPHGSFVPKNYSPTPRFKALTDLGFVVVQVDGMGTANRSKAFHDVCWHNLRDAGFPDRISWHRAIGAKYPWYDLTRVGIYGGSAGGQSSTGGLLFHPDFYKVAVSGCGCHDNRMDKASWNEQWMGYPVGPWYGESSNIDNAHRLVGKLLLIVGELDTNVPPESTLRLADALIKSGKDFDMLVVPGEGHGMGGAYGQRRLQDYFVRHLKGVEPPNRNVTPTRDEATMRAGVGVKTTTKVDVPTLDLDDLNDDRSELRGVIERYQADRGSMARSSPAADRDIKGKEFMVRWLVRLGELDYDKLGRDGQADYVMFRNYLEHEVRQVDRRLGESSEASPLVPFTATINDLDDARRSLRPMEWPKVATSLARLSKDIVESRSTVEKSTRGDARPKRAIANRAVSIAESAQSTLREWNTFYSGYDPMFGWWVGEPYKAADAALQGYVEFLRDRLGVDEESSGPEGPRRRPATREPGPRRAPDPETLRDGKDIVGNPIGREALLSELAFEMIPYSPEELVDIAKAELAWCDVEMRKAAREMGYGDDWKAALEHVKTKYVEPGKQPQLIRDLAVEAVAYLDEHELVTIPPLCRESWRMNMMTPERQLVNPFFTGGEVISVSFPTDGMAHEAKLMSLRGNNVHFSRATVHHELIPGHHLQGYMTARHKAYRQPFATPFWGEGWALYWELLLWDRGFAKSPEDKVGMLFWRMHRCARIIFSLSFHLETMSPRECIDFLVDRVGHERDNATAEVRRSFNGSYGPLYQAAYLLGGMQLRSLHKELVESGKMTDRAFHDAILRENRIPIEMVRALLTGQKLPKDYKPSWRFRDVAPAAK